MYHYQLKILLTTIIVLFLSNTASGDTPDIDATSIKYTNDLENGETVILVGNGKDYGTIYNYHIYDDDDDQYRNDNDDDDCNEQYCLPDNWYTSDFDDSNWNSSAAPFGNDDLDGVTPGTIWQSEEGTDPGVLNDNIVIRHYFNYDKKDEILDRKSVV